MDSVCEGGAVCACSDRTDAHVEHGERRSARGACERASATRRISDFAPQALGVNVNTTDADMLLPAHNTHTL